MADLKNLSNLCLILAFLFFMLAGFVVTSRVSLRDFGYAFVVLAVLLRV